ncbi:hypothetical protein KIW84_045006 [Lathyrus oleraceus]|uniref:Serine-threonine/tyrosine-protein kinase catalytic domain-containing protein n=1 Tax=Pisum sativum TaxID=3888 RepID=A0A9D4XHX2_PEA|nr:hypothetical protein KIW84_045006 [Pisum sativum]
MVEALICTQNWLKPSDNDLNVLNMTEEYEISESIVSEFQVATGGAAAPTQAGPSFFETKDGTVSVATAFAGHQEDLGINKSIFIKPKTFHLTVLMLKLWNKDRVGHIKRRLNSSSFLLNGRERKVDSELPLVANPVNLVSVIGNLVAAQVATEIGWSEFAISMFSLGMVHYLQARTVQENYKKKAAIKKMDMKASKEFFAELKVLTRVHHLNLVRLIGYCIEG